MENAAQMRIDKAKTAITSMLAISIGINIWLFVQWKGAEAYIKGYTIYATQLVKAKADLTATLAECNAALASVQAKPKSLPVICPAIPPATVCQTETIACPKAEPAPIATPVPKIVYRYIHPHYRHHIYYRKSAVAPAAPECDWNNQ
jgi:hypothetical protein